jgi:hypothetical protein
VSCALWNVPESSYAHHAMSIYSALEMIGCELCTILWNVPESGDVNDATSIYAAPQMAVCEYNLIPSYLIINHISFCCFIFIYGMYVVSYYQFILISDGELSIIMKHIQIIELVFFIYYRL